MLFRSDGYNWQNWQKWAELAEVVLSKEDMLATEVVKPTIDEVIEKLPDYGTERPAEDAIGAAPTQSEKDELIEPLAEAYWQLHPDGGQGRDRSTFWKRVNTTRPQTPKARVAKLDGQTYAPSEDVWYKPCLQRQQPFVEIGRAHV